MRFTDKAREMNSLDEIFRRLVFIAYICGWTGMVVTGTIVLLQHKTGLLAVAILLLGTSLVLKFYGEQHLDFQRLAKSFPTGSRIDEIPMELRKEVDELFKRLNATTDWQVYRKFVCSLQLLLINKQCNLKFTRTK
jgi:hypothetical protein